MSILLNSNITTSLNPNAKEVSKEFESEAIDFNAPTKESKKALKAYKEALNKIYLSIKAKDEDTIILNSGANEATSQIYLSIYLRYILTGRKNSIIISKRASIEELRVARFLESQGCRVYRIDPTVDGTIDLEILKSYINQKCALVSVPMVDDESGVIQPIEEIAEICEQFDVPLYSNATHALGKIPVDVSREMVSYLSFEGSTIHGPKGIGALYIRESAPELMPTVYGGALEQGGLRAQIKDIASVVAFAKALEDAIDALDYDIEDVRELRDELEVELLKIDGSYSLAPWALRVPNISIMAFEGVHASALLDELANKGVAAYSFATLANGNFERPSMAEIANLDKSLKHCAIGFALNIYNTQDEIKEAIKIVKEAIKNIRANFSQNICKEAK
jgi:cysteine desulfurase